MLRHGHVTGLYLPRAVEILHAERFRQFALQFVVDVVTGELFESGARSIENLR